jgi:phosphoserine phosphatase
LAERRLDPSHALAVGDGANDIPMLRGAGLGVAYHAKPAAAQAADAVILHNDLTALLYAQGYARREWAL